MREERLFGGAMINPFWAQTHLPGHRRPWRLLAACLAALGLLLALLSPALAADGALDPSFNIGTGQFSGVQTIPEIRGQMGYPNNPNPPPDPPWTYQGYQLLYGTFWGLTVGGVNVQNNNNSCIARLKPDGTLDTTFLTNCQINGEIRSVYIYPQSDLSFANYILIGGSFNVSAVGGGNPTYINFARLQPNGNLDTTLLQNLWYGGAVNAVAVQGSGTGAKILVGGYDLDVNQDNGPYYQLVRLDYLGNLDPNYTHWGAPGGYIAGIKIISGDPVFGDGVRLWCSYPKNQNGTGGNYYVLFLDSNATRPDIIAPVASIGDELVDGPVVNSARQSDNKLLICGQFRNVKNSGIWVPRNRVARLVYNSGTFTFDATHDVGGGPNGPVTQISPNSSTDDYMVLSGNFSTWNGAPVGYLARLTTTGALDPNFPPGSGGLPGLAADDRIWRLNWNYDGNGHGMICGYFRNYNGQTRGGVTGLNGDGTYNTNYANVTANAGWCGMVYSLATQSDGKIIIGGDFNGVGGKYRAGLARINPNGSLDPSFKGGVDGFVRSVAVQADGKILVAGQFGQCQAYACTSLARLNPDGSLDTAFKPMLVGGDNSVNQVYHVLPLSNGQVMIAGDIWNNTGGAPVALLNSDGSLDPTFWSNASNISNPIPGAEWAWGSRVAVAGSNYVLAGGYYTGPNTTAGGFLGRLTSSGTLDPGFYLNSNSHVQTMDGEVDDLLLQPDGKILVSGMFTHIIDGSVGRSAIARFSANGLLDTTFTPSLPPTPPNANTIALAAMARQPNGKILIEANFLNYLGNYNYQPVSSQVARLNSNGSLDSSFSLGTPAGGWFYPGAGNSILRLPNGKALIGGCYNNYNAPQAWSLVRIFAGPANFSPGVLLLLD